MHDRARASCQRAGRAARFQNHDFCNFWFFRPALGQPWPLPIARSIFFRKSIFSNFSLFCSWFFGFFGFWACFFCTFFTFEISAWKRSFLLMFFNKIFNFSHFCKSPIGMSTFGHFFSARWISLRGQIFCWRFLLRPKKMRSITFYCAWKKLCDSMSALIFCQFLHTFALCFSSSLKLCFLTCCSWFFIKFMMLNIIRNGKIHHFCWPMCYHVASVGHFQNRVFSVC